MSKVHKDRPVEIVFELCKSQKLQAYIYFCVTGDLILHTYFRIRMCEYVFMC